VIPNLLGSYLAVRAAWFRDVPHRISLTDADIRAMHTAADGHEDGDVPVDVVTTRSQAASKVLASGEQPAPPATSISGEKLREFTVSERVDDMIYDMLGGMKQPPSSLIPTVMLQDYKKFKHGKDVPQEAEINTSNSIYWHKLSCITNMICTCRTTC
jgi:hypothetical protein